MRQPIHPSWLVTILLSLGLASCVCRSDPSQCAYPTDCEGRAWQHPDCTEEEGNWTCVLDMCAESCDPQCDTPTDCEDELWPSDAGCEAEDGEWACTDQECVAVCDGAGCVDYTDCEDEPWPPLVGELDCDETQGHWECPAGDCIAACNEECNADAECDFYPWEEACAGNWDCIQGLCEEACDPVGCGDGICDTPGGETASSCAADCEVTCGVPEDCVDQAIRDLPCVGRWSCEAQACLSTCDYSTCGDGTCDPLGGEDAESCILDCFDTCQWPTDCTHESWSQICQGRHTCFLGNCQQTCDSGGCGNGTCDAELGETADSCFIDCLGGPCDEVTECLGYSWYEDDCIGDGGHWECQLPAGACEPVCDETACGDGTCDPLAGESATGCPIDCQEWDCDITPDCAPLTLPGGCSDWVCLNRNCTPVCP